MCENHYIMEHAQAQAIVPISLHVWKFWFALSGMPKFLRGILMVST